MRPRLFACLLAVALVVVTSAPVVRSQAPQSGTKKLLFLTHPALYKHTSLEFAEKAVTEWGKTSGFTVTTLEGFKQQTNAIDLKVLTPEYLNQFDALMLMTNGNLPLTDVQKTAIMDFVRNGKALIGTHCATLTMYNDPKFGEMFGGYYLRSIIPTNRVGQQMGVLRVEDTKHPSTKTLGPSWTVGEEFYVFGTQVYDASKPNENVSAVGRLPILLPLMRDKIHVLLTLDTEKMDITSLPFLTKGGDYPQSWTREYGSGRVFYTTLGHRDDIWGADPNFKAHVVGGVRWALKLEN